MKSFYHTHLETLRTMANISSPLTSIFVPLVWSEPTPGSIFRGLVAQVEKLFNRQGLFAPTITEPDWKNWIDKGAVTLGIYQAANHILLVPLPLKLDPRVVVAESFHVKPLIATQNFQRDSLMLLFTPEMVELHRVSLYDDQLLAVKSKRIADLPELVRMVEEFKLPSTNILGIAGNLTQAEHLKLGSASGLQVRYIPVVPGIALRENAMSVVRLTLSQMIAHEYRSMVETFGHHQMLSLEELYQRLQARSVKKLCVSLDDLIFGEMSEAGVKVSRQQQGVHDDDLLDDLLELALSNGSEVQVVPKRFLPPGKVFLAS